MTGSSNASSGLASDRRTWRSRRRFTWHSTACIWRAATCAPCFAATRRETLERLVENEHTLIFPARRPAARGLEAWDQVLERGYEGYVGKDADSPYRGGRTLSWLKVKQRDYRVDGTPGDDPLQMAEHDNAPNRPWGAAVDLAEECGIEVGSRLRAARSRRCTP